ncbi:neurotrypsin-like [Crotalus adamanteus]|uniref:Neurotrypsin-like n=1 Tax=Crotalus adamanteus TaxID=8729 RepID=A0AAW1BE87_CROAD
MGDPPLGASTNSLQEQLAGQTVIVARVSITDSVRLTESGRVEVYYNGLWGMICDDEWTNLDASVVCQQLGHSETGTALRQSPSSPELLPFHFQSANCRGDEKMLSQCSYQEIFRACIQGPAGATCGSSQGGKKDFEGRVEIYHDGYWGTICDDQWDDKDAEVVCRYLDLSGISRAVSWAHFGKGLGPILLDEVECSGNELSLDQCKKSDWGKHNCDHVEDAGVICDPFVGLLVRLVDGDHANEGHVEMLLNGEWGRICAEGWTERAAAVVCRQLGYR